MDLLHDLFRRIAWASLSLTARRPIAGMYAVLLAPSLLLLVMPIVIVVFSPVLLGIGGVYIWRRYHGYFDWSDRW